MRIAIDYNAALRQVAGIGRYTRELVQALANLGSDDELVLFYAARDLPADSIGLPALRALQAAHPTIRAVPIPLSERWLTILWQRARAPLPVELWTGPIDLLHAPDFVLPPSRTRHTVLTVHDLTFRIHPETAHARLRTYLERTVPRSLRRASHVVVDSRSTAQDLQRLMDVSPNKVSVLYPGVGSQFRRVEDRERLAAVRQRYQLPQRFFLHIGTIEPRKNLERLMQAFAMVRAERVGAETQDGPLGLVLAGKPGWLSGPILEMARDTPGVGLAGPIPEEDLPALYTLASGLVYPSLYEGFGFPPLEALACGTPALAANTSSLPEAVADVGLLVDPRDTNALAAGLRRLLDDGELARTTLTMGPHQAARFTWPGAAQQLLQLYRSIATETGTAATRARGGA